MRNQRIIERKMTGKFTLSKNSSEVFTLRVRENHSRMVFLEIKIQPIDLINALSGLAECPMEFIIMTDEKLSRLGKLRVGRSIGLDKTEVRERVAAWKYTGPCEERSRNRSACHAWMMEKATAIMQANDGESYREGWMLSDDGTDSQQNGANHVISLVRWDDIEQPTPTTPEDE